MSYSLRILPAAEARTQGWSYIAVYPIKLSGFCWLEGHIGNCGCLAAKAAAQIGGCFAVTGQAKGTEIVQIALTTAFSDWKDVVGIPKGAAGGNRLHTPERERLVASFAAAALELGVGCDGIGAAGLADAVVTGEDQVAEVAGVGTQTPLVDAVVRTEGAAAAREDFQLAPTAQRQTVRPGWKRLAVGATGF